MYILYYDVAIFSNSGKRTHIYMTKSFEYFDFHSTTRYRFTPLAKTYPLFLMYDVSDISANSRD